MSIKRTSTDTPPSPAQKPVAPRSPKPRQTAPHSTETTFDPARPYNTLAKLPPTVELETKPVLKACVAARAALAELRLAGDLIPNPSVLINTIPILEAKDSSEIELIVTTNDALFREATLNEGGDPATKEALRYRAALYHGLDQIKSRPLATSTAVDVCCILKDQQLDVRKGSGTTLQNTFTGEVIYTPPEGEQRLRELLANWEAFLHRDDDLDPLVKMAVLHYQFEAIHPFIDGNGRTGRILDVLVLVEAGLLDLPTLYLSRHIVRTKPQYYSLLRGVTVDGDWEPWVLYMLTAVELTSKWTTQKVRAIRAQMEHTAEHVKTALPKIYSRELVDLMFIAPYCRIADIVESGIAKRQTASEYLKALAAVGVLTEERAGRDKVFIHRDYIDLLSSETHDVRRYR
ncbi:MAG: Fic family protein [Hyphomicrobiaceae bacterium]|nr:Fic family protein [Hyphomicrobiaceae bacterium]